MYPFSLSTRSTITGSTRPTLMSLLTDRIRRRVSSDNRIIPSIPLYSNSRSEGPHQHVYIYQFDHSVTGVPAGAGTRMLRSERPQGDHLITVHLYIFATSSSSRRVSSDCVIIEHLYSYTASVTCQPH